MGDDFNAAAAAAAAISGSSIFFSSLAEAISMEEWCGFILLGQSGGGLVYYIDVWRLGDYV